LEGVPILFYLGKCKKKIEKCVNINMTLIKYVLKTPYMSELAGIARKVQNQLTNYIHVFFAPVRKTDNNKCPVPKLK